MADLALYISIYVAKHPQTENLYIITCPDHILPQSKIRIYILHKDNKAFLYNKGIVFYDN